LARREPTGASTRLRVALATGLGLGYAPLAPGTVGSLPGLLLIGLLVHFGGQPAGVIGFHAVTVVGVWAADAAADRFGRQDPGEVVIDEIGGQMLTLLFLPLHPTIFVLGFLVFRLFDVIKPPPARRMETLQGGTGIMADDLVAGVYANLVLQALHWSGWVGP
jgi:phosphatidylglycerophosphatase A